MKILRRILLIALLLIVALSIIPFFIPINEGGIAPAQLVDDPDGAFIVLQGVSVYYEDKGAADDPALLLVHGLFGSTESWRYNVDALVAAGYRVIALDRPGFGLSDKVETYHYAVSNQADLLAALLAALNIETAFAVVGHSAGGSVVTQFALRHPDRLTQLVLVDAAVLSGGPPRFVGGLVSLPPVWRWGRIGLQAVFTRENFASTLRSFYADPAIVDAAHVDVYWRAFQTAGWDIGLLGLTRDGGGSPSEADIRAITTPTLLLWGTLDTVTPLAQGERLAALLPNSTLVTLDGSGHQPFEEVPDAFNAALTAFLGAPR